MNLFEPLRVRNPLPRGQGMPILMPVNKDDNNVRTNYEMIAKLRNKLWRVSIFSIDPLINFSKAIFQVAMPENGLFKLMESFNTQMP